MNIIAYRKAALLRRSGASPQDLGIAHGRNAAKTKAADTVEKPDNACRVYRETVIVDDGQILIGVPTGDCDFIPRCHPAG